MSSRPTIWRSRAPSPSVPMLHWIGGLAAYRLGRFKDAAREFETLSREGAVPQLHPQPGRVLAARAYGQSGDPQKYITFLNAAAREQPTFYGMLAERVLGQPGHTTFADLPLDLAQFRTLMTVPAARRAVRCGRSPPRRRAQ